VLCTYSVRFVFVLDPEDVLVKTVNKRWRKIAMRWLVLLFFLTSTATWCAIIAPEPGRVPAPAATGYGVISSFTFVMLARYTWMALNDFHPRWAIVHVEGRWTGRRVPLRLDLDAAPNTYRATSWLRPRQPWQPAGKITAIRVNAFSTGDIITVGGETFSFEDARRNLAARHMRNPR
jgi:hypothetical protein